MREHLCKKERGKWWDKEREIVVTEKEDRDEEIHLKRKENVIYTESWRDGKERVKNNERYVREWGSSREDF